MTLSQLYANKEQVHFLHTQYFVEGAITGACAVPEIPLPDTWLPWVIKTHNKIRDNEQAQQLFDVLFSHFKHVLAEMKSAKMTLPNYAKFKDANESFELEQYCKGLMLAHQSSESVWRHAWQRMQKNEPEAAPKLAKDLKHCLIVFSTFADINAAISQAKERGDDIEKLKTSLPAIAETLDATLTQYVTISGKLAQHLPNQFETFEQTPQNAS
uniref:UPF0149 family protein n=1 Tax=Ningiella ruwaisensis TaxID=2364274 RepID=UPI00109F552A|nr:UPF0149 family protein [Ningiella ruwaisensis]